MKLYSPVKKGHVPVVGNIWGEDWIVVNIFGAWYIINTDTGLHNYHTGVDLNKNKPTWNADYHSPVYAIADGVVVYSGPGEGTWGWIIDIKHVNDAGQVFISRSAHVENWLVKKDDTVLAGDQIANVGNGDPDGTGPQQGAYRNGREHFHFDISYGDMLEQTPNQWPGTDLASVLAFYADPEKFLLTNAEAFVVVTETWIVNTDVLNIRTKPTTTAAIRGHYERNDMVRIVVGKNSGKWLLLANGKGWVHSDYMVKMVSTPPTPEPTPVPIPTPVYVTRYVSAPDGVNLRSEPKIANNIIKAVKQNTELRVNLSTLNNGFVQTDKKEWVSLQYLSEFKTGDVPAPIPTPSKSGWGLHIMNGGSVSGKYPIYKAVDEGHFLITAHGLYGDNAEYIYRSYHPDQASRMDEMSRDMEGALNRWFAEHAWHFANLPYAYLESYNEVGAPDYYLEFERRRIIRLAEMGRKACVLNIATGNTEKEMWQRAKGMVNAVIKYDARIGIHCYGEGVISANLDGGGYWQKDGKWSGGSVFPLASMINPANVWAPAFRPLRDKVQLAAQGQADAGSKIRATELGLDDLTVSNFANGIYYPLGIKTRGWRSCIQVWERMGWLMNTDPASFYKKQLNYWANITGLMGVVYTHGTAGDAAWDSFNTVGAF